MGKYDEIGKVEKTIQTNNSEQKKKPKSPALKGFSLFLHWTARTKFCDKKHEKRADAGARANDAEPGREWGAIRTGPEKKMQDSTEETARGAATR